MLAGNSLKICVGAGFEISSTLVQYFLMIVTLPPPILAHCALVPLTLTPSWLAFVPTNQYTHAGVERFMTLPLTGQKSLHTCRKHTYDLTGSLLTLGLWASLFL